MITFTITPKGIKYYGINLAKKSKTFTLKMTGQWWKKFKQDTNGELLDIHDLEDLIL